MRAKFCGAWLDATRGLWADARPMAMKGAKKAKGGGKSPVVPGDILLGKYRVENKLGQGGMGIVVAARHLELGELFAIKYLARDAQNEPNAVQRFLREARSSARLKGEHAVKVHDVGRLDSGMPYMIMEYLVGQDLKAYLRKQGRLSVEEAVSFVIQACDALSEAHSLGIIHRDLKPSNLFLTKRRDGTPCIKVLDFGIAKEISAKDAELTKSGATLGSPLYMSPEQMAGSKDIDTRTDIWSLGVVLYELVTGTVPFQADAITELVVQVLQNVPKAPSHHCSELPPWIDEVVMHCLEKHPENRFLTMDDLVMALRTAGKAGLEVAPVHAPVRKPDDEPMGDVAYDDTAAESIDPLGDTPLQGANGPVLTKDVSTMDSSTRDGIKVPVSCDKELASNTLTNPTWDTTKGAAQRPLQSRNKLGAMIGAGVAIVVLAVGSVSVFRSRGDVPNSSAATSEIPSKAMESVDPVSSEPMPSFAPSAAIESAPEVPVHNSEPQEVVDAAPSAAPQSEGTTSPRANTLKAQSITSAAARVEKKEKDQVTQPSATAKEAPPISTATPIPSNRGPSKGGYEGVL